MRSSRTAPPLVMPILSAGRHRTAKQGACFMEFASYLAGEKWSDHPACTHPVLAALARDVNDLTSDATRAGLTTHIHRVIGLTSEDPLFAPTIAMHAASAALPIASLERQRALAVGMLNIVDATGLIELHAVAVEAFDSAPDTERWARRHLTSVMSREFSTRTAIAMVHTSAVGIALACVPDADARLEALLASTIDRAQALTSPRSEPAPAEDSLVRG
ncbi:MAG: hypothetical protein H7226_12430 [Salinibacterium sp.]|nr:hypothetical protein [Salinibacterium sp.]